MVFRMILVALKSIGMALLSEAVIKKLVIWGLEKLVESTKTTADNELLEMVKKAIYSPEDFEKQKKLED